MASISGVTQISPTDLYTSTATPGDNLEIGQLVYGKFGKAFRYALAGGSSLVVGNVLQDAAQDTQFNNMAVPSALTANTWREGVTVTNGTTAVTAGQFKGGSFHVYTAGTVAIGDQYSIVDHGTATNGSAWTLYLDRPLRAAFSTSAKVNIKRSPWSGVIQAPATTQTGIPVGVAIYPITNAQYGWVQTHGEAAVLSDGSTFAVGSEVGTPSGTAGAATVYAAGTTHARIGSVREAAASAHAITVFLQID